ncbi:hypothetical protein [Chitinophaga nivalis]|uniref:DUF4377 domain-containing protein n=1 Tax=Chitinophaga nivalis TaxID=2991709 RepID=A0ABT3IVG4_9BACT|nr:hypothetical protein [Chitinophaga nivalis]MCW3462332.1 hypothetical protein [Chitinophaga nivalis]MCW3487977.1 hypothetical protein [Chitinophaga nivalis]
MKRFLLLTVPVWVLTACRQPVTPTKERPVQIDTMQLVAPPAQSAVKVSSNEVTVVSHDSTTYIRFADCYFSLDWIRPDELRNNFELHPDTLYFQLEHLHSIEGQMLAVTTGEAEKIKVLQSYETSVVVDDQVIQNWQHYRSDWEPLTAEANNFFICKTYSAEEKSRFPSFSISTLQHFVKQHYPAAVYNRIVNMTHFPQPHCKVAINRYYMQLFSPQGNATNKINKLLVIDVSFKG